jgi:hypothetical protein
LNGESRVALADGSLMRCADLDHIGNVGAGAISEKTIVDLIDLNVIAGAGLLNRGNVRARITEKMGDAIKGLINLGLIVAAGLLDVRAVQAPRSPRCLD